MQCAEIRPKVHTFTSASSLNDNNIIGSYNHPSKCDEESLQSSYLAENIRRNYCRVRNHLKAILSVRSIQEFVLK